MSLATDGFFRARLDQMSDLLRPLAVLARQMPWAQVEAALAPALTRKSRSGDLAAGLDLLSSMLHRVGAWVSAAGRPGLPVRMMVALLYLKRAYNKGDESVVECWAQGVYFQFFSGQESFVARAPCDATRIVRFRGVFGEAGVEELLEATVDSTVATKFVQLSEFEWLIVDSTVQRKAVAYSTDSRSLEVARDQVVRAAKAAGIDLKQSLAGEGKQLRRRAGGYAHAKQFKRLPRVLKRQRRVLDIVLREVSSKLTGIMDESPILARLMTVIERAKRIRTPQPKDKNKLCAMHTPEVESIDKGKGRQPYEFSVKSCIAITHRNGLMVDARAFPGNPYDGHILSAKLEQTDIVIEDFGRPSKQVIVDLRFRRRGRREQSGRRDHPSWPVQVAHESAAPMATAKSGGRASNRPPEGRSPDGSLVGRRVGGCAACGAVRARNQPALAAAGGGRGGIELLCWACIL